MKRIQLHRHGTVPSSDSSDSASDSLLLLMTSLTSSESDWATLAFFFDNEGRADM